MFAEHEPRLGAKRGIWPASRLAPRENGPCLDGIRARDEDDIVPTLRKFTDRIIDPPQRLARRDAKDDPLSTHHDVENPAIRADLTRHLKL